MSIQKIQKKPEFDLTKKKFYAKYKVYHYLGNIEGNSKFELLKQLHALKQQFNIKNARDMKLEPIEYRKLQEKDE